MNELVSINGTISKPNDAKISVFDRGFLFGDAIYEVTRSYDRIFFEIEAHIDRLYRSADFIQMDLGKTKAQMIDHIYKIYENISCNDIYMRIQVSRGQGPIGMSKSLVAHPNEVIIMYPFQQIDEKYYKQGVTIYVTPRLRNAKKALDPNIKSGNYLNNVLAYMDGEKHKAFETFMVNKENMITEGTTSNIFMVKGQKLITPPIDFDILEGITRRIVMGLAKDLGLSVEQRGFDLEELSKADEVFLTSSTREIVPISESNGFKWSVQKFHVMQKLIEKYQEYIHNYCQKASAIRKK
jgi:branched-chain amino acid aminotransferase